MKECITHYQCECLEKKMQNPVESKEYVIQQLVEFDVLVKKLRKALEVVHIDVDVFEGEPHYKYIIETAINFIMSPPKSGDDPK